MGIILVHLSKNQAPRSELPIDGEERQLGQLIEQGIEIEPAGPVRTYARPDEFLDFESASTARRSSR
jgi:hypothetical protein